MGFSKTMDILMAAFLGQAMFNVTIKLQAQGVYSSQVFDDLAQFKDLLGTNSQPVISA